MLTSPSTGELLQALLRAKVNFLPIVKSEEVKVTTKAGRTYTYRYAPLDAIQEATDAALSAEGLLLVSAVAPGTDGTVEVVTRLLHATSEQWLESRLPWNAFEDLKALGGLVSYGRRYNVMALLDLAAEEDVDGSQATGDHIQPRANAVATPPASTNGNGHTPAPPKGAPKNLQQKSDLLRDIQAELTRIGRPVGEVTALYQAAFGDEVDTWDSVCNESLHTVKHGLAYLKTLTPEVSPNGAQSASTQSAEAPAVPAPTGETPPVDPSPAGSSSAASDPADAAERARVRLRAEVAAWDLRVPADEVEHVIQHNVYSKARALLWKCRRQETAA